ncbi:uncharacterized protein [Aegilops tauschii subsp. strangulata]|uniref:uncharacterized protein n=1 Tax=Aegilops tauschii subsp. strangulata TaxID=200361 RepID=UPI003CC876A7
MHFHERDNLERSLCISDITYHNLVALIETEGYGLNDYIYFVREPGVGIEGLVEISDDDKVDEMLDHIANKDQTVVNLTVIRATDPRPADLNAGYLYEEQSTNLDIAMEQDEQETLMELKRRTKIENFRKHKEASEHVQMVKQKLPVLLTKDDSDLDADEDFVKRLNDLRRQREDPLLHFEGDTDVDEVYGEDEEEEQVEEDEKMEHEEEEQVEQQQEPPKKKEKRKGPTKRSHSSLEQRFEDVWVPSSDEEIDVGDLKQEYDDGAENAPFILPNGRKSRAYKAQPRKWYSEERENLEEQLCRKLCFLNVYQFRRALQTFHISQNRNYDFHRNCNDSIIVVCTNVKCPFYIAASVVANETTFCIRKANFLHTCPSVAENTKVTGKWVAHQCEDMLRIDIGTPITTIMQNLKKKYGVEISTHMAYRARKQALKVVQGDQRGVDGCFIKLSTGQQILAATGRDGNNNIYPIAFGVVDKEDTDSWTWFLTQLKDALGGERSLGIILSFLIGRRGDELKKHMDAASYSYTKNEHLAAMNDLKRECKAAWAWLNKVPVHTWARHAMDFTCKTDLVVNNISEVFNKMILDVRGKPIKTMLEGIRTKLMVKFNTNRTKTETANWEICPTYAEMLEEAKYNSRWCQYLMAGPNIYQSLQL